MPQPLFTPRFFLMCGFTFTVFLSAFQLLPTAPYRILQLGGGNVAAGLFLGFLTYASACSAPFTGALADRFGRSRTLLACSLAIFVCSGLYAIITNVALMLALVLVHGFFWSGLLSASGAYVTDMLPSDRRAEGLGYWGLSTTLATALAPNVGLWLFSRGEWWMLCASIATLNLAMAFIAWRLPDDRAERAHAPRSLRATWEEGVIDWRVTFLALTCFLYAFGYGGVTSFVALYTEARGVTPRALFFTVLSIVIVFTRPFIGRWSDRFGHRRVLLPSLVMIVTGYLLLTVAHSRATFVIAAVAFATGFGSAYPALASFVMSRVSSHRRAAAYGSIIAAFDTGIGTGSISLGWVVEHYGYEAAFGVAAAVAALAIPYFTLWAEPRFRSQTAPGEVVNA